MTPRVATVRRAVLAFGLAILLAGCVAAGGYGDDGYGTAYYGTYGGGFRDWGPGYAVGPFRDNGFRRYGGGYGFAHHWRRGRFGGVPFIPNRHGGFHGGFGHGR